MMTLAPRPAATLAALAPTTPPPRIDDVRREHARHAAEQNAAALERPFQVLRPFLNAHPPGDFAHRRQQRQRALARRLIVS